MPTKKNTQPPTRNTKKIKQSSQSNTKQNNGNYYKQNNILQDTDIRYFYMTGKYSKKDKKDKIDQIVNNEIIVFRKDNEDYLEYIPTTTNNYKRVYENMYNIENIKEMFNTVLKNYQNNGKIEYVHPEFEPSKSGTVHAFGTIVMNNIKNDGFQVVGDSNRSDPVYEIKIYRYIQDEENTIPHKTKLSKDPIDACIINPFTETSENAYQHTKDKDDSITGITNAIDKFLINSTS